MLPSRGKGSITVRVCFGYFALLGGTCITEYGVIPMSDDWDKTLALREGDFRLYRSRS